MKRVSDASTVHSHSTAFQLPKLINPQVVCLSGKADNTIREMARGAQIQLFKLEGASLMQRLVTIGAIKNHTRNITVISLGGAQSLFQLLSQRDAVGAAELLAEVKHLRATSTGPPPVRHQLGAANKDDEEWAQQTSEAEDNSDKESADITEERTVAPQPQPRHPQAIDFPTSLTKVYLQPGQEKTSYALSHPSYLLQAEIDQFMKWSRDPINTERSIRLVLF
jgi:hypothetical protein